jgi:protein-S-isoprenylcysteine O-methyltransferase Ste14
MNPWFGKALLLLGLIVTIVIRAPYDARCKKVTVVENRKGRLEILLLVFMGLGTMIIPLIAIFTRLLSFADYPLSAPALFAGAALLGVNFWLFYRSHADLGTNWSMTLEVRENHALISSGVYSRIRHPMYSAIFLYAIAQAMLLPNWIAGPACLVAFIAMFAFRVGFEEKMMTERFGQEYRAYMARTKRLIPGIW